MTSGHGHQQDRGLHGFVRYMKMLPKMWRSPVSREVVRTIAPQPGEHVVDVGAGMGPASVVAAKAGASVLAVDPTPYMRHILGIRRFGQRSRAAIRVVEGSAESIPSDDGSVDALWTVNTMHHWADLDAAVRELARVLRPGGRVVLVDEDFDSPAHPAFAHMHAAKGGPVSSFRRDRSCGRGSKVGSGRVRHRGGVHGLDGRPSCEDGARHPLRARRFFGERRAWTSHRAS